MSGIFNKEQEEAITHKDGPLMVLAGPGSGKIWYLLGICFIGGTGDDVDAEGESGIFT